MHTFRDSKNRTWSIDVNCDTIEQVKAVTEANLLDLLDGLSTLAAEVAAFPPLMAKLIEAAIAEQIAAAKIEPREFRRAMGGDALNDATDALLEELVLFCPRHRRQVSAAVLEKQRAVEKAATELALERLADPDLGRQVQAALETQLRRKMQTALEMLGAESDERPSAIASSIAAGTPPGCSASPAPALLPGDD